MFEASEAEGRERLGRSVLGQMSTGFTAGFNIVFAIVALGITHHLVADSFGRSAGQFAGALAFGVGLTFPVHSSRSQNEWRPRTPGPTS